MKFTGAQSWDELQRYSTPGPRRVIPVMVTRVTCLIVWSICRLCMLSTMCPSWSTLKTRFMSMKKRGRQRVVVTMIEACKLCPQWTECSRSRLYMVGQRRQASSQDLFSLSYHFLIFSCDQPLWMVQSIRPSVHPSVCHTFLIMFLSSYYHEIFRNDYYWQKWCPCKRWRSEVKGQGHGGQNPI